VRDFLPEFDQGYWTEARGWSESGVASAVGGAPSDGGGGESCAPANIRGHGSQHHRPRPSRGRCDLPDHGRRSPVDPRRDLRTRRCWCPLDELAAQATRRDLTSDWDGGICRAVTRTVSHRSNAGDNSGLIRASARIIPELLLASRPKRLPLRQSSIVRTPLSRGSLGRFRPGGARSRRRR
jgi:hypothetical protein